MRCFPSLAVAWILCSVCAKSVQAAEPPYLKLAEVDEVPSELLLHGVYLPSEPSVYVDGIKLKVVSWDTTTIRCSIPSSGTGSCGPIQVIQNNIFSNLRTLTGWHLQLTYKEYLGYRDGGFDERTNDWWLFLRADAEYFLKHSDTNLIFRTSRDSRFCFRAGGHKGAQGSGGNFHPDTTCGRSDYGAELDLRNRILGFEGQKVRLDGDYEITRGSAGDCDGSTYMKCHEWRADGPVEFAPALAVVNRSTTSSQGYFDFTLLSSPTPKQLELLFEEGITNVRPSLYAADGRELTVKGNIVSSTRYNLDLGDFSRGLYFLRVQSELGVAIKSLYLVD
jgi:hypothetical protein